MFFVILSFCMVTDFSGEDKASDIKFCTVVRGHPGQGISHFEEFYSPETQNRTNQRAATSIADRRQSPPLKANTQSMPSACVDIRPSGRRTYLLTSKTVFRIVQPKCMLGALHAAPWWVCWWDRQTDGQTPDRYTTLSARLDQCSNSFHNWCLQFQATEKNLFSMSMLFMLTERHRVGSRVVKINTIYFQASCHTR